MTDIARPVPGRSRPRFTADLMLTTCGISVAVASLSFAGYMLAFGPTKLTPRFPGEFSVFAQFDRRSRPAGTPEPGLGRSDHPQDEAPVGGRSVASTAGIDFLPTGSVAPAAATHPGPDATPTPTPLQGFVLRDVFDGTAVIQSDNRLRVVRPGSVLAGAGAVRSIEYGADGWVVLTDRGAIMRQPQGVPPRDEPPAAEAIPSKDR